MTEMTDTTSMMISDVHDFKILLALDFLTCFSFLVDESCSDKIRNAENSQKSPRTKKSIIADSCKSQRCHSGKY